VKLDFTKYLSFAKRYTELSLLIGVLLVIGCSESRKNDLSVPNYHTVPIPPPACTMDQQCPTGQVCDLQAGHCRYPIPGVENACEGYDECYAWQACVNNFCKEIDCWDIDRDGYGIGFDCLYSGRDCNDDDPTINSGMPEIPYDGIDQNCDGSDFIDLDRDGYPSIVVEGGTDCDDNNRAVYPGRREIIGNGIDDNCRLDLLFTYHSYSYPTSWGDNPCAMETASVSNNDKLDLFVVNYSSSDISVIRNRGDLSENGIHNFTLAARIPVNENPHDVALCDINGDGEVDFFASSSEGLQATIGLGNGAFHFSTQSVEFPGGSRDVACGDLNGDGLDDLITSTVAGYNMLYYRLAGSNTNGTWNGSFDSVVQINFSSAPSDPQLVDFNQDGTIDIAASISIMDKVAVLQNYGNAVFSAPNYISISNNPANIVESPSDLYIDDYNSDNYPDIAVANSGSANVSILLYNRSVTDLTLESSFTIRLLGSTWGNYHRIIGGDFNHDGAVDILVSRYSAPNLVAYPQSTAMKFDTPLDSSKFSNLKYIRAMSRGHFNNDTWDDIITFSTDPPTISILIQKPE
jgi:FG-GAP-like repeat/Putative metal-binding motif